MVEADLKWAIDDIRARQLDYSLYQDYYYGKHKLAFATDKFQEAFGSLLKAFADNLCPVIVDTVADRLEVTGFSSADSAEDDPVTQVASELWRLNRMDKKSSDVHTEALRTGDAYVIVWPDEVGTPYLFVNEAHLCTVWYDAENRETITKAAKLWFDDTTRQWRLTLYYPDRIEKYATLAAPATVVTQYTPSFPSSAGQFQPYQAPGETWPLPNPWDVVPVFHFSNGRTGAFGRSELADAIPIQDALNKTVCDLLVAQEFIALPQRWITGVEAEIDPTTGRPTALFIPGANRVWTVGAPDAQFGQFPGADLEQYVRIKEGFREDMAIATRTPLHYFKAAQTEFPSGEALKTADAPLASKLKRRKVVWGNVWEDVMSLALRMAGVTSDGLNCVWANTEPRNQESELKVLEGKKRLGVSQRQVLREAGYTDEQIEQFLEENQVNAEQFGEQLLTAFERDAQVNGATRSQGQRLPTAKKPA